MLTQAGHHFAAEAVRGAVDVLFKAGDWRRLAALGMHLANLRYEALSALCLSLAPQLQPGAAAPLAPGSAPLFPGGSAVVKASTAATMLSGTSSTGVGSAGLSAPCVPLHIDDAEGTVLLSQCAGLSTSPFGRLVASRLLRYNAAVERALMGHLEPRSLAVVELDLSHVAPSEEETRLLAHLLKENPTLEFAKL